MIIFHFFASVPEMKNAFLLHFKISLPRVFTVTIFHIIFHSIFNYLLFVSLPNTQNLVCGPMLCMAVRGLHFLIFLLCIVVDSL